MTPTKVFNLSGEVLNQNGDDWQASNKHAQLFEPCGLFKLKLDSNACGKNWDKWLPHADDVGTQRVLAVDEGELSDWYSGKRDEYQTEKFFPRRKHKFFHEDW